MSGTNVYGAAAAGTATRRPWRRWREWVGGTDSVSEKLPKILRGRRPHDPPDGVVELFTAHYHRPPTKHTRRSRDAHAALQPRDGGGGEWFRISAPVGATDAVVAAAAAPPLPLTVTVTRTHTHTPVHGFGWRAHAHKHAKPGGHNPRSVRERARAPSPRTCIVTAAAAAVVARVFRVRASPRSRSTKQKVAVRRPYRTRRDTQNTHKVYIHTHIY